MYNKILIKNKMNEILRGDTDMLARKYIGRSADNMRMKEKEKILADIYMSFNDELKKNKKVKSDAQLRIEEIDNEMKNIRNGDRDELLGAHIKNYDPTMSNKDKDEILGKIYDGLQDERNKLDKEPTIITPPEPPENPKLTTLPDESVTVGAEVKPLSNTSGYSGEKRTPRGMTDLDIEANMKEILHGDTDTFLENNAEMYGFAYDPDMSAVEKEDILGCIYDILTEERRKLKAGEYDVKPENPLVEEKTDTVSDEVSEKEASITQIEHDMNEILHDDRDYVIETYAPKYGIEYDDGYMSEKYKDMLIRDIYHCAEVEHAQALGLEIYQPRPASVITAELDNKIKNIQPLIAPVNERMSAADVRQQAFNSMDRDTFLENHQEEYGYYYSDNMSEAEKTDLYRLVKSSLEEESNDAQSDAKKVWDANYAVKWIEKNVYDVQKNNADINFTYNTLLEQQAYAWAEYLNSGTEYAYEVAQLWDLAEEKFLFENTVGEGGFLSDTIMSELPSLINNAKAGATTAISSGVGGFIFAGPAGMIPAAEYGFAAGVGLDKAKKNSGMAYKAFLAAGVPIETAMNAAKINGVSSAVSEMLLGYAGGKIEGKIPSKIISAIVNEVEDKLGEAAANAIGDKLSELYVQYHTNE